MGVIQPLDDKGNPKLLDDGITPMYGITHSGPIVGVVPKGEAATAAKKGMN